jgi:hypothetical protein
LKDQQYRHFHQFRFLDYQSLYAKFKVNNILFYSKSVLVHMGRFMEDFCYQASVDIQA